MPVVFTIKDRKCLGSRAESPSTATPEILSQLDAIIAAYEKQREEDEAKEAAASRLTADLEAENEAKKQHDGAPTFVENIPFPLGCVRRRRRNQGEPSDVSAHGGGRD